MRYKFILPVLSATLLVLAFPRFNLEFLAWVALIPLFFALENKKAKERFATGYLFGIAFFSGILYWLINVTIPGTIILILLLSFAPAIFTVLGRYTIYACPPKPCLSGRQAGLRGNIRYTIFIPSAWVFTEYLRAHLFTGFPWALLAYSQSSNLPLIQIADITGAYGISFLIVLVNFGVYLTLKKAPKTFYILFSIFMLFALVWTYGQKRINYIYPAGKLKVSVIQGNIPQALKWNPLYKKFIIDKYRMLSKESMSEKPHLIIWPETAVPGYLEEDPYIKRQVFNLAASGNTHLLAGTLREENSEIFNSATLISNKGKTSGSYDKIHLVPFGEFVPFERLLSPMRAFIDKPMGDFKSGKEFTVFKFISGHAIHESEGIRKTTRFHNFSVLICFEDIFPGLARHFVNKGARFLVNITNDAWFGKTSAPYQHAQSSVFRAVENRVPVVRAANTGLSCIIDHRGKILSVVGGSASGGKSVREAKDEIFVEGYATGMIAPGFTKTFYTRFGDIFSFCCIFLVLFGVILRKLKTRALFLLILSLILAYSPIAYTEGEVYYRGKLKLKLPFGKNLHSYNSILVTRVIDGDTIELENRERVRLIGIDTPEAWPSPKLERDRKRTKRNKETIIAMGKIAAKFTRSIVKGKKVRLEFDVEKKDRYGRLLAYVYLPDGRMLNAELVKEGYAKIYTFPPNVKYVDMFRKLQKQARENNRGLWDK